MSLLRMVGYFSVVMLFGLFLLFYVIGRKDAKSNNYEFEKTEMLKLGAEMYRAQVLIAADSTVNIQLLDSMFIEELKEVNDTLSQVMKTEFAEWKLIKE